MLQGVNFVPSQAHSGVEPNPPTILIVEDHLATRRFLADNLAADGYEPLEADSAHDALRVMSSKSPDLAIVDLALPDRDGLDLLREVRASDATASRLDPRLPVIVLTGRGGELDRVRGFERGCDDYVVKPFSYAELRGRIGALLTRARHRPGSGRLRVGPLEVDPLSRTVEIDGRPDSPVKEGVRAPAGAGGGADACIHARGAPARSVGLSLTRPHANARLACLAAAQEARRLPGEGSSSTSGASVTG